MTSLTFAVSRAISATLRPGDRIVGTRLDHDANITPWRRAADAAGADHVLASFDPVDRTAATRQRRSTSSTRHTKWVTVPGASNLLGSTPDLVPIIEAAHAVGANVYVDAVHLAPHRRIDIAALGCDALVTSPYKWYGPHSGVLWMRPELLESLPVYKVRPASDHGPSQARDRDAELRRHRRHGSRRPLPDRGGHGSCGSGGGRGVLCCCSTDCCRSTV